MEACEFWTALCESEIDKDVLRPYLPRVLPVLLKNMVSSPCEAAPLQPELSLAGWLGTCKRLLLPAERGLPSQPACKHSSMCCATHMGCGCFLTPCCLPPLQAYEPFDEEVQEAEELEQRALGSAAAVADRDDEIKPYIHK